MCKVLEFYLVLKSLKVFYFEYCLLNIENMQNIVVNSSEYFKSLDDAQKQWYLRKLRVINGIDPYTLPETNLIFTNLPKVSYFNLVNYLVFQSHTHTAQDLNYFKSMKSFNFYASGLVKKVWVHHINSYAAVLSKVSKNN